MPESPAAPLLDIRHLEMRFGGLTALADFSLALPPGRRYGLIGPNGAGKTTVFNVLTGFTRPQAGSLRFMGQELLGLAPHEIARRGIARTFQNIRLFSALSVLDNVLVALQPQSRAGFFSIIGRLPRFRQDDQQLRTRALDLLGDLELADVAQEPAHNLPYGHQRRLEIARSLATAPQLLLLDEPAAGLNPSETRDLLELLTALQPRYNLTLLLIEHNMKLVMELCHHLTVLNHGLVIAQGPPADVRRHPEVIRAYLGRTSHA